MRLLAFWGLHMTKKEKEKQGVIGNLICQLLTEVYVTHRQIFEKRANAEGVSIHSLAAAAVTGMLVEMRALNLKE